MGALAAAILVSPSAANAADCEASDIECRLGSLESADDPKDFWDKLSASSTLLTGGLVALAGLVVSNRYNQRKLRADEAASDASAVARRAEVAEKFFPHLASGNPDKIEAAIVMIQTVDPVAAARLARLFPSDGGIAASRRIESSTLDGSEAARTLLDAFENQLADSVVSIVVAGERRANGLVVGPTTVVTPAYVVKDAPEIAAVVGGELLRAVIERVDLSSNIAVLTLEDSRNTWLEIGEFVTPSFDQRVYLVSDLRRSAGRIIGRQEMLGHSNIVMAGRSVPGEGGAPVVDGNGRLIGIVATTDSARDVTGLIPADVIASVVESTGS